MKLEIRLDKVIRFFFLGGLFLEFSRYVVREFRVFEGLYGGSVFDSFSKGFSNSIYG